MGARTIGRSIEHLLLGRLAESDRGECPVAAHYETRTGTRVKKTPARIA